MPLFPILRRRAYFFWELSMTSDWIIIFFFIATPAFLGLLVFAGWLQLLRYQEWKVCISKGWVDPAGIKPRGGSDPLQWAVVLFFAAIGMALGIWPVGLADPKAVFGLTPWMLLASLPLSVSVGLMVIHFFHASKRSVA
jgi:hypothetical protein